jgi:hypothetical protein
MVTPIPGKLYRTHVTGDPAYGTRTPLFSEKLRNYILYEINSEEIVMFVGESRKKNLAGNSFIKVIYRDMIGLVPTNRLELHEINP